MSFSIELDRSNGTPDFRIVDGRLVLSNGADAVRDRIFMRLSILLGGWVFDLDLGVAYLGTDGILGGKKSQAEVEAILRRAILEDPEVDHIQDMNLTAQGRAVSVSVDVVIVLATGATETINVTTGL